MKAVTTTGVMVIVVCAVLISGLWAAGLPEVPQQLKALQPNSDYKITDIVGKKVTVSDPTGAQKTLEGLDTKGLKVGDTLKGSALQEKLGQTPSMKKDALPNAIPKPSWK
ncbi:MAG: hypothetical protein ABSC55_06235 [Syntrophorhabdales bacterium]|jgi:hypothetical protein